MLEGIESVASQRAAVSPEYNNQRKRERDAKTKRDQEQANIAKSIDTNISGNMPNGDPAPKRAPKGWKATILKIGATSAIVEDFYNNSINKRKSKNQDDEKTLNVNKNKKDSGNYILTPIIDKLNEMPRKGW